VTVYRTERVLAYMAASSIGLAILGIIALLIVNIARAQLPLPVGALLTVLPAVGLTLGLIFAIAFIVVSAVRRTRAARNAAN
jgi:hypothetical protein